VLSRKASAERDFTGAGVNAGPRRKTSGAVGAFEFLDLFLEIPIPHFIPRSRGNLWIELWLTARFLFPAAASASLGNIGTGTSAAAANTGGVRHQTSGGNLTLTGVGGRTLPRKNSVGAFPPPSPSAAMGAVGGGLRRKSSNSGTGAGSAGE
jgi:hypothetical protein